MSSPSSTILTPRRRDFLRRRWRSGAALLLAFAIGVGASALAERGRRLALLPLVPGPIAAATDGSPIAVRGQVAEIFGNKFILADASGRALVDTGRAGEGGGLVVKDETVTVEGRFERGIVHAAALSHADGRSERVGPVHGWRGERGPSWLRAFL